MTVAQDSSWFKDAIIYQTHIKAFFDSTNDGIGDFEGLIQKLDYIQELGVTAVWLLPFYPSPLRDDGYDIQDYRNINPAYGKMADVRRLVKEAHKRGLKVITELVINHSSDQHPWFQASRRAKGGDKRYARYKDYYVWSDTDQKYKDARIIFLDTEVSNWTWDPVAKAYFWHRFYSHQPDLNFDNPAVMREVKNLLHYWLNMGVDGLRLDAIPYLVERDGTNCENLDETHAILKQIRAEMDKSFPDKMLLAEANQWPEDTRPYFGEGDECHMAFHFPLMPRMYMAIAQEDRHPITDIMRQTPEIPENCQWAIFLRNHDELTLEMVTERERAYLWNTYAADRRARINMGIRRRLAPLMDNDRRKIELMNGLLFSMPGTPVVYYGDEIGMGDNIYLGDRDGVRTPMQWSPDRNGGFSRANPQLLFLPAIQDPIYGYEAVNVEAQQKSSGSLLNWMKRIVAVRQARHAFGRGAMHFLYPDNRKILAYTRTHADETVLCVFNLSRNAQAVTLDLHAHQGRVPVELLGRTEFPPIADTPYTLTLPAYGFFWFALAAAEGGWRDPLPEALPDFVTVVLQGGLERLFQNHAAHDLTREVLPAYLPKHRWFSAKDARITGVKVEAAVPLDGPGEGYLLVELEVGLDGAPAQRYLLPLAVAWGEDHVAGETVLLPFTLAKVRRGPRVGVLHEAVQDDDFVRRAVRLIAGGGVEGLQVWNSGRADELRLSDDAEVRRFGAEQSNTSVLIDNRIILKAYRRLQPGIHPEIEIGRFLTEVARFPNTPPLLGAVERTETDGTPTALLAAFGFVANQGDGWRYTLDHLDRDLEEARLTVRAREDEPAESLPDPFETYVPMAGLLGRRTAEMHRALAIDTDDPAFAAEPVTGSDLDAWRAAAADQVARAYATLERVRGGAKPDLAADIDAVMGLRGEVEATLKGLDSVPEGLVKTRLHGDYHLGQVLVARGDFVILDFEGEPLKSLAERRAKNCPVRDVAGMLRSFDYAQGASLFRLAEIDEAAAAASAGPARDWHARTVAAFMAGYEEAIAGCPVWPTDPAVAKALLDLFLIEKIFYEVVYEAQNRPGWLKIPVQGIVRLFSKETEHGND